MGKILRTILVILGCGFLVIVSLNSLTLETDSSGASQGTLEKKLIKEVPNSLLLAAGTPVPKMADDINSLPLRDNMVLYASEDPSSVVTLYLTARRGNANENTAHSWADVNAISKPTFGEVLFGDKPLTVIPKVEAIVQMGDENGPQPQEFGYGQLMPNATVQVRGSGSSIYPQKSYKIELMDSAGLWRGQRTIALNKHPIDLTRSRNKLAFDLMEGLPGMVSLRTQFIHLYVKDETTDPPGRAFVDYGLYTQIEQPNTRFLRNHLLDRYGQLYKATMFEWFRYPDAIRSADDPLYDENAFQKVLEIKGNRDHSKLIRTLEDVNNWSIPIETTFSKYFDEENYFTWMAFNILIENVDTAAQNYYLYSPQNSEKWYFLPWDYDGDLAQAFTYYRVTDPNDQGIADYWGNVLHRRVLTVPAYRKKLDKKMRDLLDVLTPERLNKMLNNYRKVTDQYSLEMPDVLNLPGTVAMYNREYSLLPDEPRRAYAAYLDTLGTPMPFHLGTPVKTGENLRLGWEDAYDFNAQDITYKLQVAKDWDFKEVVAEQVIVNGNRIEIPMLQPGTYFWRVIATNENGKSVQPFDYYLDVDHQFHFGLKYLQIGPNGEIFERLSG
jgi:spore coat protein H